MLVCTVDLCTDCTQGDQLSGKPGNVREIYSCQESVRNFAKKSGKCQGKIVSGKSGLKLFLLLAAYLHPFLTLLGLCISFWFWIMHCCIPTPTTSTGMI